MIEHNLFHEKNIWKVRKCYYIIIVQKLMEIFTIILIMYIEKQLQKNDKKQHFYEHPLLLYGLKNFVEEFRSKLYRNLKKFQDGAFQDVFIPEHDENINVNIQITNHAWNEVIQPTANSFKTIGKTIRHKTFWKIYPLSKCMIKMKYASKACESMFSNNGNLLNVKRIKWVGMIRIISCQDFHGLNSTISKVYFIQT